MKRSRMWLATALIAGLTWGLIGCGGGSGPAGDGAEQAAKSERKSRRRGDRNRDAEEAQPAVTEAVAPASTPPPAVVQNSAATDELLALARPAPNPDAQAGGGARNGGRSPQGNGGNR